MDIAGTYEPFRIREQHDAVDPMQRTSFDEFGRPKEAPTIEGFDLWGKLPESRHQAQARVRRMEQEHEHAKAVLLDRAAEARRRCNRLMQARNLVMGK